MEPRTITYWSLLVMTLCSIAAGICEEGWEEYAGHCYYVSPTPASWHQAHVDCLNMGAQLTSILNYEEDHFIDNITSTVSAYHWIGLKRQYVCTEDFSSWYPRSSCTWQWQWTDNSSTYYIRRRYFPGNGDCLLKTTSQTLMRWDCSQSSYEYYYHINYICKKDVSVVPTPEVTSTYRSNMGTEASEDMRERTDKTEVIAIAVAVVASVISITAVSLAIFFVVIRRRSPAQRQQQSVEPNSSSVPAVSPSAPPLELLYDNRTEDVRVQSSVQSDVFPRQGVSRKTTDVNTQDEHVYTSLMRTSASRQINEIDNPVYNTQTNALSTMPSGASSTDQ